jgi:integrase
MPGSPRSKKIGLRDLRSVQPHETRWDGTVAGFGARRQSGRIISYIVVYRTREGRQRTYTIGKHGSPWTPDTARQEARRILGEVARGADPLADKIAGRQAITVAELCRQYLIEIESGRLLTRRKIAKKESTLVSDRGRIVRHIIPLLGKMSVKAVTRDDVEAFMHDVAGGITAGRQKTRPRGLSVVRGGRGVAGRTVGLLGAIFTYAVRKGLRIDNPAHGVVKFAEGRRERRLTDHEYRQLGMALAKAEENVWQPAIAATRLMALTGWRRGEALNLHWSEVDLPRRTARLADTKTGASLRPLSQSACAVIHAQPRNGDLVFASRAGEAPIIGYRKMWLRIAKLGDLPADITPHVLRHSFASLAADLGYAEPTIASLLGHKTHSITSRYIHSADTVLLAAADAVANETLKLMLQGRTEAIKGAVNNCQRWRQPDEVE